MEMPAQVVVGGSDQGACQLLDRVCVARGGVVVVGEVGVGEVEAGFGAGAGGAGATSAWATGSAGGAATTG